MFEVVTVSSGAKSLRCLERKETFHPKIGPAEEARILHVEQQRVRERALQISNFTLWDVGLGAAANALAALEALRGIPSEIHSFDSCLSSLQFVLENRDSFPYIQKEQKNLEALIQKGFVEIDKVRWFYHHGDFRETMRTVNANPHSVFYDPYSPKTNADMWSLAHFKELRKYLGPDCLLTNYSRSTAVRVTLLLAGFYVGAGRDIGEKAETTIFSTRLDLLERPLQRDWITRVRASGNSAPMRGSYSLAPIAAEDLALLERCEQFA